MTLEAAVTLAHLIARLVSEGRGAEAAKLVQALGDGCDFQVGIRHVAVRPCGRSVVPGTHRCWDHVEPARG